MKLRPLDDRIVVKPEQAEEKTAGGIVLPDNAKEKPQKGEIMAVGPGKISDKGEKIGMSLKKGDKVLYGKYTGTEVTVDGEDYIIMQVQVFDLLLVATAQSGTGSHYSETEVRKALFDLGASADEVAKALAFF